MTLIEKVTVEDLDLTNAERAMDVVSATSINWGRTTVVKMQTAGNYEVIGIFTVGRYREREDNDHVRVTMARGNAMQRLQHAMDRRTQRPGSEQRIAP